ncbi:hypothetical protein COM83_30785, partial [Bacillus cereus]
MNETIVRMAQLKMERKFKEFNEKLDRMSRQLEKDKQAFAEEKKVKEKAQHEKEYNDYLISIGKKERPIEMSKADKEYYNK